MSRDSGRDSGADGGGTFTIAGTVTGRVGTGLTLKNGTETLALPTSGAFVFKDPVARGAGYAVTVTTQPSNPTQLCTVTNGSGTATANVKNVAVNCVTSSFPIAGTVTGLSGTGLVLEDNNGDPLAVTVNGAFTFATAVSSSSAFSVTVMTQPSGVSQNCTVTGGTGIVGGGQVSSVVVNCTTDTFTVAGQIAGLGAGSVVLQDNGGNNVNVSANGSFAFSTPLTSGAAYAVTVLTQPVAPEQVCIVATGTGHVTTASVTSVRITCTTNAYTIGGTVSGLSGAGLVLQDNGGSNLTVTSSPFVFATPLLSGAAYAVTVLAQPSVPSQTCVLTTGTDTGSVVASNVSSVAIVCTTNTYTVGGAVSGLSGAGLVLQDNGGDNLTVAADGTFVLATPVASGAPYAVTVLTQPSGPTQFCTVAGGTATVAGANVTSVTVTCATSVYAIGGTVSGLSGTLVLEDNGGDDLSLTANGSFAFATPVASGVAYAATVFTQPGTPSQTCVVTNGSGTVAAAAVTTVTVACTTNAYTVGGTVSGLSGTGLVLQDNGGDSLPISANGAFVFLTSVTSGTTYSATASAQPTGLSQTCTVTNGAGTMGGANVTNVTVLCTTNTYAVGGTVSGLLGTGLVLRDNGGDGLTVTANGTFSFATPIASGSAYVATTFANPSTPSQTCVVTNGGGTVTNAIIANIVVSCTTNTYSIGGTLAGLSAADTVVLLDNGGSSLSLSANGAFAFATKVASGATYNATLMTQPGAPSETCTVSGGTGTVGGANVTSVAVNCTVNSYTIGGTVTGVVGTGLVLQDNLGSNLSVTASGTFAFATPIASGATYSVTTLTNPSGPSQTCTVTGGTGTVGATNVTSVAVGCVTNRYTIGGTLSGLGTADTVVLQDNLTNNLSVTANGAFTFTTTIPSSGAYSVTVLTNPASPVTQICAVTVGSGTVVAANVTNVAVACTTQSYTIGGTVAGMTGTGLVLQDNGGNNLSVAANGTFTFTTSVASGSAYDVTVLTQPLNNFCAVAAGVGTMGGAPVTGVTVTCGATGCGRFTSGFTGAWSTVAINPLGPSMGMTGYLPSGGSASAYLQLGTSLVQYTTSTNTYTTLAPSPVAFQGYANTTWYNGGIWTITSGSVIGYSILNNTWTTPATGVATASEAQTAVDDSGNLWGYSTNNALIEYNIAAGTSSIHALTTTIPGEPRIAWDSCSALFYAGTYSQAPFYSFNPATGVQTTLASIPGGLSLQDGFCGDRSGHIFAVTNSSLMYQYTISTGAWAALPTGGVVGASNSACGVGADGFLYATDPEASTAMYRIQLH
jgi:hypothetical protein